MAFAIISNFARDILESVSSGIFWCPRLIAFRMLDRSRYSRRTLVSPTRKTSERERTWRSVAAAPFCGSARLCWR